MASGKSFTPSGSSEELRVLLGSLLSADWRQALIARGYGWHVDVGTFSTPVVGGGNGTVLDADQPELVIDVPAGQTLVPLRFHIEATPGVQTTDDHETEVVILVDRTAVSGAVAANGTVESPLNMRTDRIGGCPLSVVSAVTTNLTAAPTASMELAHVMLRENFGDATGTELVNARFIYEPMHPPFIVGPATLACYYGGDIAANGFINADFLAIPSGLITGLV